MNDMKMMKNSDRDRDSLRGVLIDLSAPDFDEIQESLDTCLRDCSPFLEQYRHDFEQRFCLWRGQSRDGRRWQENLDAAEKVRPWDGASDVRTFTGDEIVNSRVKLKMAAWRRAQPQVTALRSANLDLSNQVTRLLQWRFRTHLARQLDREVEKVAQWSETYGLAVMGIWWEQCRRLEHKQSAMLLTV